MGKSKSKKITPSTPALPKADEFQLYRSNLFNPLLQELVTANRLGSLLQAREEQDQVKFTGLYKLEQYLSELKEALENIPNITLSALPGDVVAGVQMHHSASNGNTTTPIIAQVAPPSHIDTAGSYLHGTTLNSSCNVDINITLPETFFQEKDFQNYSYFDKRALYVAATALHLRHYDSLRFSNLYITHEVNDQNKPIIIIHPNVAHDIDNNSNDDDDNINQDGTITTKRVGGFFAKFIIILHFVPSITSIAMRKLAPNRNNTKIIEQQRWIDYSTTFQTEQQHKSLSSPLSETILINNIAPTPDYNHTILTDLLSTSQTSTYSTLLNESSLIQSVVIVAKVWFKLRGLYLDCAPQGQQTNNMIEQCSNVNIENVKAYKKLCKLLNEEYIKNQKKNQQDSSTTTTTKGTKKKNAQIEVPTSPLTDAYHQIFQTSPIHYSYRHHYNQHSFGLTGAQITHLVLNLFLSRTVTVHNNIQHCMDAFFRFLLLRYPDNKDGPTAHTFLPNQLTTLNPSHNDNLITTPLVLPPDYDDNITISTLQQAQEDYKALYEQIQPSTLFHAFDVIMLDCNGIYNILYNINISTWNQIQGHALYSLKAIYGNNMGSLLSHDITPELLSANFASILRHAQIGPLPDDDIFTALYMTRLTHSKHTFNVNNVDGTVDFDDYLKQLHSLYLVQLDQLCQNDHFVGPLKTKLPHQDDNDDVDIDGKYNVRQQDEFLFYLQSNPQYNQDYSLLNFDGVYDVSLPINYIPYYPVLNAELITKRLQKGTNIDGNNNNNGKKKTKGSSSTAVVSADSSSNTMSDVELHQELLVKVGMVTSSYGLPLFIQSNNNDSTTITTTKTKTKTTKPINKTLLRQLSTVIGTPQTPQQLQLDGDIVLYIPYQHLPTLPLWMGITQRMTNILSHSLNNRVYSLYIEPRINSTHTSFIWRVNAKLDPIEANRGLDKGPHAEQQLRCKEWRNWWGLQKSELRRFPDGAIMEVVVWNHSVSSYPLPNEQIPFIITQYILPLHLFTSTINTDMSVLYSNRCVVTTTTHPLGIFLQSKTNQHLIDSYCDPNSSYIVQDGATINPYQHNDDLRSIPSFASPSLPIPNTLLQSYNSLTTMLREMTSFPLGIDNVDCTSALLRGTTPFYPQQHFFDVTKPNTPDIVNHFFHQLSSNTAAGINTLGGEYSTASIDIDSVHNDPKHIANNDIFEPINVVLTLGNSNKWPQNDLLAVSRIKTAFYLKLAQIIRTEYSTGDLSAHHKETFSEAQKKVMENQKNKYKKNKKDNSHVVSGSIEAARMSGNNDDDEKRGVGPIYSQVTPYYIDIYIQGYCFRCRIINPTEISLFRSQTSNNNTIPPLVLGDGLFRSIEKEYLHRPKHNTMIKNFTTNFPILATTTQFLYRWFQSHFVSRHITIELCELLVSSIFVQSYPFTIPTSLPAALSRILYRLSTFPFDSKPIIIPNFDFSMSRDADAKLTHLKFKKLNENKGAMGGFSQHISVICANHTNDVSYYHQEYTTDLNVDQFPNIYNSFHRRTSDSTRSALYIVTPYDLDSRAWTTRPATHTVYQDHLSTLLSQLSTKNDIIDELTADRILSVLNQGTKSRSDYDGAITNGGDDDSGDDDDDDKFVKLHQQEELDELDMKNNYRNYYASLIDRGEQPNGVKNAYNLITSLNLNDIIQLQQLTNAALSSFTVLFFSNTNLLSHIPIKQYQYFQPQRQVTFNKELWPLKAPLQWSFKHWLGLFKPNLARFDAFILLSPNVFTIDQIKRSIWLFRSKNKDDDNDMSNGGDDDNNDEYLHFIARMTNQSALLNIHTNSNIQSKNATNKDGKKKKDYKLPPDLAKKLKQQEEMERLALNGNNDDDGNDAIDSAHNTINFMLYSGQNYVEQYLSELRATFGQYASFYSDPNGSRLIAVKFHPFFTHNQVEYSLSMIKEKIITHVIRQKTKQATTLIRGINDAKPHIKHPLQPQLHLVGLKLPPQQVGPELSVQGMSKKEKKENKKITAKNDVLSIDLQDLVIQMAQLGQGIVQNVYMGFDEFIDNIYF